VVVRVASRTVSARDSLLALFHGPEDSDRGSPDPSRHGRRPTPCWTVRDAAATRVALSLELYRTHTKVCRLRTACMTWKSPGHLVGREGPGSS